MELRSSRKLGSLEGDQSQLLDDNLSLKRGQTQSKCQVGGIEWILDSEMETELVKLSLRGSDSIRLNKWQDWPLWFDQLKIWCKKNEIWDDVNPETNTIQPINKKPVAPKRPQDLNNDTRANFQIENAIYLNDLRDWKEKDLAMKQLDEILKTSIGEQFKQNLLGKTTEREKLRALFEQVKPTVASIKADLKLEYELLKVTPHGRSINEYFSRWQILCMKCQTKEHSIFVTGEEDPSLALHEALKPIHPVTAIFRANQVNDNINAGREVKLSDEIKAWQTFLQSRGIIKFSGNTSGSKNSSFISASFDGKSIDHTDILRSDTNTSENPYKRAGRPECLCGKFHDIAYCNYLNPDRPRPNWWKPNKDVKAKIEKYCKNNPEFAREVYQEIEQWKNKHKSKEEKSKIVAIAENIKNDKNWDNIGAVSLAGSASSCSLNNSVILDSGTNVHILNNAMKHRIVSSRGATDQDMVYSGDSVIQAVAVVRAEVYVKLGERSKILTLHDALYIPDFMSNLVSLKRLNKVGLHHDSSNPLQLYYFENDNRIPWAELSMSKSEHWIIEKLPSVIGSGFAANSSSPRKPLSVSPAKWHKILGHPGLKAIESLPENTEGCEFSSRESISTVDCESCLLSKAKAIVSRRSETHREISKINEGKHMVVVSWDIIEMSSGLDGSKYISHFYYDTESFHHVRCTKTKAEAAAYFKQWFPKAEQLFGARTAFFRSDLEGSIGKEATKILDKFNLTRLPSAPETPAQNGAAEASGKVVVVTARTLRVEASLPENLWPWLCETSAYLLNRTPTKKLGYRTPFEMVTGKRPSLAHLNQIGCKAYALRRGIPKKGKMEERANIGYLLGYASTNIFYVWIPELKKVIRTRDVVFKDEIYDPLRDITLGQLVDNKQHVLTVQKLEIPEKITELELDPYISSSVPTFQVDESLKSKKSFDNDDLVPVEKVYPTPSPTVSRELTPEIQNDSDVFSENIYDEVSKKSFVASDEYIGAFSIDLRGKKSRALSQKIHRDKLPPSPSTWKEVLKHPYKNEILAATKLEFNNLSRDTFEIVDQYEGHTVPLKWVWTYKYDSDGYLTKFKSRLCVRGDLQLPTLQDTYAATLAMKTFRAMMGLTCAFGLETRQYDLVNAFCNAELSPHIYCKLPPGFEHLGGALKVKRALYGLRESPKLWSQTLKHALYKFGFEDVPGVNCLMRNRNVILLIYVDDLILLYWPLDAAIANDFENNLSSHFKTTIIGEARWFLGVEIIRNKTLGKLWLSQRSYCEKLGSKFDVKGRSTYPKVPLPPSSTMVINEARATKSQIKGYQQKVGSIGYAAVSTRPDIAKAHAILSQFLQNPSERCLEMADHLLSYLYGSKNLSLSFDKRGCAWQMFCDSSYADNEDKKSSQGLLFTLFGGAIEWKATKQRTITTSTTEAELLALSSIGSSSYWWKRFFSSINFDTGSKHTVFCDNRQAVRIANSESECIYTKLRHVDIHQLWIRQETSKGDLIVKWIPTSKQKADGFTKLLSKQPFENFISHLGLQNSPYEENLNYNDS